MAPFPHPAHRTGLADLPHPALGQDFTPSLSRATPSAASEHLSELIGFPISMSFTTYCVCLDLDRPHPALGQDFTPSLSRATPSAASEHLSELIGFPISMSFTTYCVCLELRSLPSTGITRLQRYYEPL